MRDMFFTNLIEIDDFFITLRNSGRKSDIPTKSRKAEKACSWLGQLELIRIKSRAIITVTWPSDGDVFVSIFHGLKILPVKSAGWLSSKATEQIRRALFRIDKILNNQILLTQWVISCLTKFYFSSTIF